ncbi:hypothetical protein PTKIN_Ptkin04bG0149900 [Pterospermum kingtungense]
MDPTHLNIPELEHELPELDCCKLEENPFGNFLQPFEVDSFNDFNDCNLISSPASPGLINWDMNFKDLDISGDFVMLDQNNALIQSLYEDIEVDAKPPRTIFGSFCDNIVDGGSAIGEGASSGSHGEQNRICRRKRSVPLEYDEIQKYFDFPITKAAKEMNVGLTVLKKRCRELNIMGWPHRKIKSLKTLINNVRELGLTNEITMLEEHQRMLEKLPDMELTETTKKLRQACFKASYKKRRSLAAACY